VIAVPQPRLRDERLAWLAVRDELARSERRTPSGILTGLFGGRRRAKSRDQVISMRARARSGSAEKPGGSVLSGDIDIPPSTSKYMMRYSLAVDEVAGRLSREERVELRRTGRVPDWFLPAVRSAARKI
jgi:hypothetical protein